VKATREQDPAYRATLLFNMCTETDSPLICLCKSV